MIFAGDGVARVVACLAATIAIVAALSRARRAAWVRERALTQRLAAVEQVGATGSFELDLATLVLTGTAMFEEIHRLAPSGKRDWADFITATLSPEGQRAIGATIAAARWSDTTPMLDYTVYGEDGTPITDVTLRCLRSLDPRGVPTRIIGIVRAQPRNARKDAARDLLAAQIVHDLNNTLSPITMLAPLLIARHDKPADQHGLHLILESARRAKQLLAELRSLSRSGMQALAPVRLDTLVHDLMPTLRARLPAAITIVAALDRVPAVRGEARQIGEAVRTLVDNAARAIGQRPGSITVGTLCAPATQSAADSVRLFVRDDGASLAPAALDLAIAQAIATTHGGSISVRALPGAGTEIAMVLPATASVEAPGAEQCLAA